MDSLMEKMAKTANLISTTIQQTTSQLNQQLSPNSQSSSKNHVRTNSSNNSHLSQSNNNNNNNNNTNSSNSHNISQQPPPQQQQHNRSLNHNNHRARQLFSFTELAGTDLTLLLDESLMFNIFGCLSFHELYVAKRVCSRWKPLCESRECYMDLDMQSFIQSSRYLPKPVLFHFLSTLSMQDEELDALKSVCRDMPRMTDPEGELYLRLSSLRISTPPVIITHVVNGNQSYDDSYLTSSNSSNASLNSSNESPTLTSGNTTPNTFRKSLVEKDKIKKEKLRKDREKRMEESIKVWNDDIIPNWDKKKGSKKVKEYIFQGIPSLARGKVWPLLIGNDLNITPELFSIFGARAERAKQKGDASLGREGTVTLIQLDLPRTFPMLSIFQDEGPLHQSLANVLEAYVCYRPDVGYVQGMSYLAALFLLILDEYNAFVCLANLLNSPCYMTFYTMNLTGMEVYMKAMDSLMLSNLPKVHKHLKELGIQPDIFMIDWVLTVFSKALPLDVASHVWDNLFLEGELFIFQVALGILKMYSKELETGDFDVCMTLLTHLPSDIDDDELFSHISSFTINPKLFSKLVQ